MILGTRRRLALALVGLAFVSFSCGGGSTSSPAGPSAAGGSDSGGVTSADEGTPTPSPSPEGNPAPLPPTGLAACPMGYGDYFAACSDKKLSPQLLADVDAAINLLVEQDPTLFDTEKVVGDNGYLVLDPIKFHEGVVANLRAAGYCAEAFDGWLDVKNTSDFSERYDILLGSGHIRRGPGSIVELCTPARFPVDPLQAIDQVRVSFHDIKCPEGVATPNNGDGLLPVGCVGALTATPKDVNLKDVPLRIHGPEIAWDFEQQGFAVAVEDIEEAPFNKKLHARNPGRFSLCATVAGIRGCLNAEVIP